ncbi:uncharacterized protein CC84DRAFT_132907 [Paraphaeosphaeria sporulosa]|uniref:Uncharacterized protein n=1 Tax=Paraphaeosphaeria sporulosa TaxID=1460663 RepID=A0A177CZU9_9PLEO|nr:uncharacterized protein CC84DRAFT_132907 [Paraphaeosphaeria sporulosa]OAG12618.1 hypothetical protein CC84DRAFT_132907 [Paraphaeosphaeria sporulosa]
MLEAGWVVVGAHRSHGHFVIVPSSCPLARQELSWLRSCGQAGTMHRPRLPSMREPMTWGAKPGAERKHARAAPFSARRGSCPSLINTHPLSRRPRQSPSPQLLISNAALTGTPPKARSWPLHFSAYEVYPRRASSPPVSSSAPRLRSPR